MKKIVLIFTLVIAASIFTYAQKYAYVDTEYILENIPEYETAQEMLEDFSIEWQKEIEKKFEEIDKLYKSYQADAILLPEDMKQKREEEIIQKEREAKELQKKRFGQNGDLFKKRQELIKPIQDKIFNAIQAIAETKSYAFVFDKTGSLTIMFADPRFDISDDVLKKIGNVMRD